jgi:hypothetical protein
MDVTKEGKIKNVRAGGRFIGGYKWFGEKQNKDWWGKKEDWLRDAYQQTLLLCLRFIS